MTVTVQVPPVDRVTATAERVASAAPSEYRPDIDGLRAVAVLAVMIFHLEKGLLPGGFVGVDVFFVISGYLITGKILKDCERGTFSLSDFYRSRVKRIAPMMMVVSVLVFLCSQLLLLPEDATRAAKSVVASMLSLANVYFWRSRDADYFAADSAELPMLHVWSLSVEEQFYVLWPLALLGLARLRRLGWIIPIGFAVAAASIGFSELYYASDPSFTYYLLPSRASELLIGALLAAMLLSRRHDWLSPRLSGLSAVVGLTLVMASAYWLDERLPFPGLWSLPPTIGAALVILGGHRRVGVVGQLLSVGPIVTVGRISYSAYLWHWPLIAFYRYAYGAPSPVASTVLFCGTLGLAWLSYRYIEQPTRAAAGSARQLILKFFAVPALALSGIALLFSYPERSGVSIRGAEYVNQLTALRAESRAASSYPHVCQRPRLETADVQDVRCVVGDSTVSTVDALLWGDSNAAHYIGMLEVFAQHASFRFRNVEVGSCPPVDEDSRRFVKPLRYSDCEYSRARVREIIDDYPVVIMASKWPSYQGQSADFLEAVFRTVTQLTNRGKLVILIGNAPAWPGYDRRCPQKALTIPFLTCEQAPVPLLDKIVSVNDALRRFAERTPNVEYYDANNVLCPENRCGALLPDGRNRLYDAFHLTLDASTALGQQVYGESGVPAVFGLVSQWGRQAPRSSQ